MLRVLLIAGGLLTCGVAEAKDFIVNQSGDGMSAANIDTCPGVLNCNAAGGSDDSDCTLREALFLAACEGGAVNVTFAAGVSNVQLGTNATGRPEIDVEPFAATALALTITGNNTTITGPTFLTGQGGILLFDDNIAQVTLKGLHFTGGNNTGQGGAVDFEVGSNAVLDISNCVFDNNQSGDSGGALAISEHDTVTISDSVFSNNRVEASDNGGGGAISVNDYTAVTILRTTIINNSVTGGDEAFGGGIAVDGTDVISNAAMTIRDSLIAGNSALCTGSFYGEGGGAFFDVESLDIHNTTFFQNTAGNPNAGGEGGAGGGFSIDNTYAGTVVLNNLTVSGNSVSAGTVSVGSGIYVFDSNVGNPVVVTLSNSIISGNNTNNGDECDTSSTVSGSEDLNTASITSAGHNLIGKTCTLITATGDIVSNTPGLDSALGATTPTQTLALQKGSAAIDAGNPAKPLGTPPACETADQRGQTRPVGAACDIGAYEFVPNTADVGIAKTSSANVVVGQAIVYSLLVTNAGPMDASNVTVSDALPSSISNCTVQPSQCAIASDTLTCTFPTLANGGSIAILLSCTATTAGTVTNTATVAHSETDPNPSNDTSTVTTTVAAAPANTCPPATTQLCGGILPASVDCEEVKACVYAVDNGNFQGSGPGGSHGCSQMDGPGMMFLLCVLLGLRVWRRVFAR